MSLDCNFKIDYFKARGINLSQNIKLFTPKWMIPYLPIEKDAFILDIGCGQGSFVGDCVTNHERKNIKGIDTSEEVVQFCRNQGFPVELIDNLEDFIQTENNKYDFIYMSHVLEHLPKSEVIPILYNIRTKLLKRGGLICIVVPNAQSSTHAYWAYEDFTHNTLFTTGSLKYVLCASGFDNIEFIDLDGTSSLNKKDRRWIKFLLPIYKKLKKFEMYLTSSYYHKPSPISYAWEIKAVGYNLDNE